MRLQMIHNLTRYSIVYEWLDKEMMPITSK